MVARRLTRRGPSSFLVASVLVAVASLLSTASLTEGRPQAAGEPVGASATNGTVSFAAEPAAETASVSAAGKELAERLANSALAPPVEAAATSGGGGGAQPAAMTGMPQLARPEAIRRQQHELAVGAIEKALLGIPRTIPDDEALQRLGEHLEAQAAAQRKKEREKFSARIIKGWGFGGGGFLIG